MMIFTKTFTILMTMLSSKSSLSAAFTPLPTFASPTTATTKSTFHSTKEASSSTASSGTNETPSLDPLLPPLAHPVALVTGSSQGIGRAIAMELAKHGCKIVINDIPAGHDRAEAVSQEIIDDGGDAIVVEADVSQPDQIAKMFAEIKEHYGRCDILVNNAGIARDALVARMKPEQWQSVIDLNLSGVHYCTQEFLKMARKQKSGRIVNIASVVGQIGNPGQANYSAAKSGVIALTRTNAKEFAKFDITVNAVCPGFIASAMTDKLGEGLLDNVRKQIPLRRLGRPEDVAGTVRFLAVDEAAGYVTGHCFDVDGGIGIGAA